MNAALRKMKTVNLSQDVYDQCVYFFSLVAALVNLMAMELRPKFQEEATLAQLRRQPAAKTGSGFGDGILRVARYPPQASQNRTSGQLITTFAETSVAERRRESMPSGR